MGKPATTYFCGNGHLLEDNAHHCYGPRDIQAEASMYGYGDDPSQNYMPKPCEVCGSVKEIMVMEWHDSDYWADGEPDVPLHPVRHDKVERKDNYGNIYFEDVPVYDMSKRNRK
jgi:hypothetical protein